MINVTKTTLPPLGKYIGYLKKIWANNWVTNNGEFSIELEKELEEYLKVKNLLLIANGTLAMQLAFKALGLTGEVITTPFTFPATTNALLWEGLKPVFADINPETFNIDPKEIEKKITKNTSAILAVHVFGNPCDTENLERLAKKYHLKVIYDAAHAFGVEYKGKSIFSFGDVSTLSFHAAKVFHTIEGGAIICKENDIFEKLKLFRNHGIQTYDKVVVAGINAKITELQAAMGLCVLEDFEKNVEKRKEIYNIYSAAFSNNSKFKLQKIIASKCNYSYFPLCFIDEKVRDEVYKVLFKNGIMARKYFYPPCNEFPYIKYPSSELPNSTKISHTILCLPLYADLFRKDQQRIINLIKQT